MSEEDHKIPVDLDAPVPIWFWEPFDFMMLLTIVGMGFALDQILLGAILAITFLGGMKKLKKGAKRGVAQHGLWRIGFPTEKHMLKFPPPYITDFSE